MLRQGAVQPILVHGGRGKGHLWLTVGEGRRDWQSSAGGQFPCSTTGVGHPEIGVLQAVTSHRLRPASPSHAAPAVELSRLRHVEIRHALSVHLDHVQLVSVHLAHVQLVSAHLAHVQLVSVVGE